MFLAMNDANYLKCPCERCGNRIEFPEAALGKVVNCPHCGQPTRLQTGQTPAAAAPKRSPIPAILFGGLVVLACAGAGAFLLLHRGKHEANLPAPLATETPANPAADAKSAAAPIPPKRKKAIEDLKTGDIQLDKAAGSSLVYAVGTMTNDSDFQRFGVRIELDVLNSQGAKIGTAKDYAQLLEPRHEWKFRALLLNPKAASARVASIKEED